MKKYRPSNGSEGEWFKEMFCYQCSKDKYPDGPGCDILGRTLAYNVDDPKYPEEWQMPEWDTKDPFPMDKVKCIAFKAKQAEEVHDS